MVLAKLDENRNARRKRQDDADENDGVHKVDGSKSLGAPYGRDAFVPSGAFGGRKSRALAKHKQPAAPYRAHGRIGRPRRGARGRLMRSAGKEDRPMKTIGRASCRERVGQYG